MLYIQREPEGSQKSRRIAPLANLPSLPPYRKALGLSRLRWRQNAIESKAFSNIYRNGVLSGMGAAGTAIGDRTNERRVGAGQRVLCGCGEPDCRRCDRETDRA